MSTQCWETIDCRNLQPWNSHCQHCVEKLEWGLLEHAARHNGQWICGERAEHLKDNWLRHIVAGLQLCQQWQFILGGKNLPKWKDKGIYSKGKRLLEQTIVSAKLCPKTMLITMHSEESGRDSKETIVGYIFMLTDKLPAQTGAKSTLIFTA